MKITLANLASATTQQVFDQVAAHLLHQNERSVRDGKSAACVYRGDNGLKCAAGCLIDDTEYKPEFDQSIPAFGTSWGSMVKRGLVPKHNTEMFIEELQDLHDGTIPSHYSHALRRVAETYNLKTDVLDKVTLANLEYKTAQEVFDQAAIHLLTQKEQCTDSPNSSRCVYRGRNGMKCAAGALMADHEYKPEMDNHGISGWANLIQRRLVPDVHVQLIINLQSAHDNFLGLDDLRIMLCDIATKHKLNTDAIKGM